MKAKKVKEVDVLLCDICGAEIPTGWPHYTDKCDVCHKDVCRNCIRDESEDYVLCKAESCKDWEIEDYDCGEEDEDMEGIYGTFLKNKVTGEEK